MFSKLCAYILGFGHFWRDVGGGGGGGPRTVGQAQQKFQL